MDAFLQKIPTQLLQLLAEIGFLGANNGFAQAASAIFEAIVKARPDSLDAQIAQGCGLIFSNQIAKGVKVLFQVLNKDPQNEMAKSFLAVALKMANLDKYSIETATSVIKCGRNPVTKQLAQTILDSYKTAPSPTELHVQQIQQLSKTH